MATRKEIILSSLLFFIIHSSYSEEYFEKIQFHKLEGNSIETTVVYDDFQCMLKCKRLQECTAINLAVQPTEEGLYECVLIRNDAKTSTGVLSPSPMYHHYTRVLVRIVSVIF
jgi:hypothetical protein